MVVRKLGTSNSVFFTQRFTPTRKCGYSSGTLKSSDFFFLGGGACFGLFVCFGLQVNCKAVRMPQKNVASLVHGNAVFGAGQVVVRALEFYCSVLYDKCHKFVIKTSSPSLL